MSVQFLNIHKVHKQVILFIFYIPANLTILNLLRSLQSLRLAVIIFNLNVNHFSAPLDIRTVTCFYEDCLSAHIWIICRPSFSFLHNDELIHVFIRYSCGLMRGGFQSDLLFTLPYVCRTSHELQGGLTIRADYRKEA